MWKRVLGRSNDATVYFGNIDGRGIWLVFYQWSLLSSKIYRLMRVSIFNAFRRLQQERHVPQVFINLEHDVDDQCDIDDVSLSNFWSTHEIRMDQDRFHRFKSFLKTSWDNLLKAEIAILDNGTIMIIK